MVEVLFVTLFGAFREYDLTKWNANRSNIRHEWKQRSSAGWEGEQHTGLDPRALARFEPYLRICNGSYAVHYADGQPRTLQLKIHVTQRSFEELKGYLRI
jgi:hypothetical protein